MDIKVEFVMKNILKLSVILILLPFLTMCSSNELVDKSPEEKKADLYYAQGTSNLIKKKYTEALTHLLQANKLRPNNSQVKNNLAMAYYFKGQTKTAIDILNQSIELNPKNSDAKINLGSIYFQTNQLDLARGIYQEILKDLVYKYQFRTHYNLALIALKQNQPLVAQKHLYLSLKEKNDYCPALFQLGVIERDKGNDVASLRHFKESTKSTCVNDPRTHFEVAKTYLRLGKKSEAEMKLLSIIRSFPSTTFALTARKELRKLGLQNENIDHLTRKLDSDILDLTQQKGKNEYIIESQDF